MRSQHKENTIYIVLVTVVATIGGFLFGFDSGVINGTLDGLQLAFNSDSIGTGFNVASMLLGCAIGAFVAGRLADIYGRRALLITAAILFLISAWGSGISTSSLEFIFYRILGGLAVGAASVMAPAYISEIAPARYRGILTTIQQIAIIFGLFIAFLSNYFLAEVAGGSTTKYWLSFEAWRWMFWMELIPATLFFILLFFIPESPRYLVLSKKIVAAKTVLTKLYGPYYAEKKFTEIQASIANTASPKLSDLKDVVNQRIRPIVWVGIGLATFQQLVGINVVFYYGSVLWQAVGFSESDALLTNVITGAVSIIACILTISLIEKIGRKPLLMIGSIGMSISLGIMVAVFSTAETGINDNLDLGSMGLVALIFANIFVFFFNMSWGPVMWVMLGEMYPNQIRGSGLAVAGFAQWTSNFIVTMMFPLMLAGIGLAGAYSFYFAGAVVSIIFVAKIVKETKGIELENMQG
jgi:SP family sugar:H+ symporter-like MFS transporter